MDVKLDSLIEKIRKEGIEEAEHTSEEIISTSKKEASEIVKKAKQEAAAILKDAEKKAAQFQENSETAVRRAARDTELLVKERITGLFDSALKKEVSEALSPDFLKDLILKVLSEWVKKNTDVEIEISGKDKEKLIDLVSSKLKKDLKDSVTIKLGNRATQGFRIGLKDEHVYYDFSEDSIAEALRMFLNPTLREILEKQDG